MTSNVKGAELVASKVEGEKVVLAARDTGWKTHIRASLKRYI